MSFPLSSAETAAIEFSRINSRIHNCAFSRTRLPRAFRKEYFSGQRCLRARWPNNDTPLATARPELFAAIRSHQRALSETRPVRMYCDSRVNSQSVRCVDARRSSVGLQRKRSKAQPHSPQPDRVLRCFSAGRGESLPEHSARKRANGPDSRETCPS
jgi:hypothetical protein